MNMLRSLVFSVLPLVLCAEQINARPLDTLDYERTDDLPQITILAMGEELGMGMSHFEYATLPLVPAQSWHRTLEKLPGLVVQDSFGGFDPPRLSVRGSGIQSAPVSRGVFLSVNGFPSSFADGSFNLALLDASMVSEASLIPGPLAGVAALGGALSFGTRTDPLDRVSTISMGHGSNEAYSASTRIFLPFEPIQMTFEGSASKSKGWRHFSEQERLGMILSTQFRLNETTRVSAQLTGSRARYDVPGPLPFAQAFENPKTNFQRVLLDRPRREIELFQIGLRLDSRWEDIRYSIGMTATRHSDEFFQLLPNGITDTDGWEAAFFANGSRDWQTVLPQETSMRFLLQQGWNRMERFSTVSGERGVKIGDHDLRPVSAVFAANHRLQWNDQHALEAGISMIGAQRRIRERMTGSEPTEGNPSDWNLAPRLAWLWNPEAPLRLSLSWARSWEAPTYSDLLETTFTPPPPLPVLKRNRLQWQRADSFELRAQGQLYRTQWSSSLYYARWFNEFLRLRDEDGSVRGTVNADRTRRLGWEGSVDCNIIEFNELAISLRATVQVNESRFDNDPVYGEKLLAGIPRYSGTLSLFAVYGSKWRLTPSWNWQAGQTYADHSNTLASDGFGVLSIDAVWLLSENLSLLLHIGNALDKSNIASTAGVLDVASGPAQPIFLPGTGRRFEVRMDYSW